MLIPLGHVSIRSRGIELPARAFDKQPRACVRPGDIVDNKLLGAVLTHIRAEQIARDEGRTRSERTRRDRRLATRRLEAAGESSTGHL